VASAASAVVVIPFENQTADSSLTTFGEMAADRLSLGLSRAGIADVIDGRARVRQGLSVASPGFIQDSEQLVALAREKGAGTIVTGRYYRAGNALYVIAQSEDADGKTGRFAEEAGPVSDPQELLRRVEQRLLGVIASTRDPRMTAATSGALSYPTYAAYSQYVEGLRAWAASDSKTAAPHFLRAMELDSTFVAVIPLLHNALHMTGRGKQADSILVALGARRDSLPAADRALIDWTTAWMNGRREDMFEAAQRWVTATPRSPDALWYLAFSAVTTNRYVMAADLFSRIDLQNGWTRQSVFASVRWQTAALHFQGRYREEQALARETRERHPQDPEGVPTRRAR
jgi:TolB-like protein